MRLNELLKKHGFSFSKKYGQNFISDENLLYAIAEKGGVDRNVPVIEIGCGAGTLTKVLCEKAKFVYESDFFLNHNDDSLTQRRILDKLHNNGRRDIIRKVRHEHIFLADPRFFPRKILFHNISESDFAVFYPRKFCLCCDG
mgnify:CR=1 FL=1